MTIEQPTGERKRKCDSRVDDQEQRERANKAIRRSSSDGGAPSGAPGERVSQESSKSPIIGRLQKLADLIQVPYIKAILKDNHLLELFTGPLESGSFGQLRNQGGRGQSSTSLSGESQRSVVDGLREDVAKMNELIEVPHISDLLRDNHLLETFRGILGDAGLSGM